MRNRSFAEIRGASFSHRMLMILSLPPPATGQSIISGAVRDCLKGTTEIRVVNTAKSSFKPGASSLGRVREILSILSAVARDAPWCDSAYLVVSQSTAGNCRDLLCLWLLRGKKITVHLHGGGIRQHLFDRSRVLRWLNNRAYRDVRRVIVLGNSLREQFEGIVPSERVFCVPNFAEEAFFATPEAIRDKFLGGPLRLCFLSNMIPEKGYADLIRAVQSLEIEERRCVQLCLVGKFESSAEEDRVREMVSGNDRISVHGSVTGDARADFLKRSHVFVLPTYYPYEGQPVSILEAYAAGCVVVTTLHNGIPDIFVPTENGFAVDPKKPQSIAEVIRRMLNEGVDRYQDMALLNHHTAATQYTRSRFCGDISRVMSFQ